MARRQAAGLSRVCCGRQACAFGETKKALIWRAVSRHRCSDRQGRTGRLASDGDGAFVLEVDEAAFARIATDLKPRVTLVTNLFRDQLDRYGEVDTVAERWRVSLKRLPPSTILALNADDPAVAALADDNPGATLYYGVESTTTHENSDALTQVIDTRTCPRCRAVLAFAPRFYSHVGHWSCAGCGFSRPAPQVSARVVSAGIEQARFMLTYACRLGRGHDHATRALQCVQCAGSSRSRRSDGR